MEEWNKMLHYTLLQEKIIFVPASIVTVPEEIPVSEVVTMAALTPEPLSDQSMYALPLVPSLVSFSATFK